MSFRDRSNSRPNSALFSRPPIRFYQEFDAENTFEGRSFDIAVTLKF